MPRHHCALCLACGEEMPAAPRREGALRCETCLELRKPLRAEFARRARALENAGQADGRGRPRVASGYAVLLRRAVRP